MLLLQLEARDAREIVLGKRKLGLKAELEGSTTNKPISSAGNSQVFCNLKIRVNTSLVIDRVQSLPSCARTSSSTVGKESFHNGNNEYDLKVLLAEKLQGVVG